MLNQLDQNAATALREQTPSKSSADLGTGEFEVTIDPELTEIDQALCVENELAVTKLLLDDAHSEREDTEQELRYLKETHRGLTQDNRDLNDSLSRMSKMLHELQVSNAQLTQSRMEAQEQLRFARDEAERTERELVNYRTRAKRIIEDLRATPSAQDETSSSEDRPIDALKDGQIRDLEIERDGYLSELSAMRLKVSQLERIDAAREDSADELKRLTDALVAKEKERKELHQETVLLNIELETVRQQTSKLIRSLYEKDQEIAGLRKRSNTFQETVGDNNRIKTLTQSLIQKQTTLEEVTAERNELRIQLEKIESQYNQLFRQGSATATSTREAVVKEHLTDDDKAQLPLFILQDNPFDNRLAKRIKRVIRSGDASFGGYLRRYPLLRMMFLVYTVLLHLWVMFVLMSSSPN